MKLVLANNHDTFLNWCKENEVNPSGRNREVKYVCREQDMLGYNPKECEIIQIGNWYRGKSFEDFSDINYRIFVMSLTGAKVFCVEGP